MKKFVLISLAFLSFSSNAQTSVYHPFPENNAVWNIRAIFYCWLGPMNIGEQTYSITFSNDTLIGGQVYHKLVAPYVAPFTSSCGGGTTKLNVYKGAIRQDPSVKKVFIVPADYNTEQLLYDFNMQVGDTVKGYIGSFSLDTVQSIDSVLVGSTYRKRWNINSCYNISLIEGIGSTYGLIVPSPGCTTDQVDYSITCFRQNGQTVYPAATTNCELITSVTSVEKKQVQVNVYPNPSNGSFIVESDQSIQEIILTDVLGNIVIQQRVNNLINFQVNNLQSGTYMVRVIDRYGKMTNRKIIIYP